MASVYGTLNLTIVEARNLPVTDSDQGGSSDPYVVVSRQGVKEDLKTKRVENSLNPAFNHSFQVQNVNTAEAVKFEIYDADDISADDCVGACAMTLAPVADARAHDVWLVLEHLPADAPRKDPSSPTYLHVYLQFYPAPGQSCPQLPPAGPDGRPFYQVACPPPRDASFFTNASMTKKLFVGGMAAAGALALGGIIAAATDSDSEDSDKRRRRQQVTPPHHSNPRPQAQHYPGQPQPGQPQPGMMGPGMMGPGMMGPGMMGPGRQQPYPGQPQPGMMQPGMQQPGMQQPGMMQPGMQQPGMPGMPPQLANAAGIAQSMMGSMFSKMF